MLRPDQNRLDYGKVLAPPADYHMDFAIGTTYSLDLEALVGATMALGLSAETDTNLIKNPVCLLEALKATADRIVLFCEAGQIHTPGNVSELYILLEKIVYSVALPGSGMNRYASFHPKFWLIRYVKNSDNEEAIYRVVVSSRNLTFDRSWDVTYYMDARLSEEEQDKNFPVSDFIRYLAKKWLPKEGYAEEKQNRIYKICRDLSKYKFEPTNDFKDFEFIPNNVPKYRGRETEDENGKYTILDTPLFLETFNELLIMSPFLSNDVMIQLQNRNKYRNRVESPVYRLFTRKEALGKLHAEDCSEFEIYCLKDRVVQGEDCLGGDEPAVTEQQKTVSDIQEQDIHAKLYYAKKGSYSRLYLGSLNASDNGVKNNIEFMICLQNMKKGHNLNIYELSNQFFNGDEDSPENPFERVALITADTSQAGETSNLLEYVVKAICRGKDNIAVIENSGNEFSFRLHFDEKMLQKVLPHLENIGCRVTVRPLFAKIAEKELSSDIQFSGLSLLNLSVFFVISVSKGTNTVRRVVEIKTENMPDNREDEITRKVLNNKECFYRYIAFLLGDNTALGMMETYEAQNIGLGTGNGGATMLPALYEKMLKTAATEPKKLEKVGELLTVLNNEVRNNDNPDGTYEQFKQLYSTFQKVVKLW